MIAEMHTEELAELNWEQRLLRNASRKIELKPEYQELKFTLHRKLLDRINLDALPVLITTGYVRKYARPY
jgi:hypothetical protein